MKMRLIATLAVAVICLPMASYAQNKIDEEAILLMIEELHGRIDGIELIPGPRGPTGFTGPSGPAGPAGAAGGDTLFEYVGTAGTLSDGSGGFGNFSRACNAAIPGSRMCTSEEVFRTVNPPQVLGFPGFAWVQPVLVVSTIDGSLTLFPGVPGPSHSSPGQMNCDGWTEGYAPDAGLALELTNGSFIQLMCDNEIDVACCAPPFSP